MRGGSLSGAALIAVALAAPAAAAERTVTYSIASEDAEFRRVVRATLADPRGWSLGGAVRFREVRDGARFVVTLKSSAAIPGYGGCSAYFSCFSAGQVLVNADRWAGGVAHYRGRLREYRRMVVNHEVGHALGLGHAGCARTGALAPIMQQQSKGLDGCRHNAWPTAAERRLAAARLEVRARPPQRRAVRPRPRQPRYEPWLVVAPPDLSAAPVRTG